MPGLNLRDLRNFLAEVTALHRWFGLSNAHHAAAIAVKGAAALLLLFLLLSGAILWMPGYWTRTSLAVGIVPRLGEHARARNLNWHKVTGFWLGLPLTIVVLTGVIMAYPWANAQLFRLAGSPLPVRNGDGANPRRHAPGAPHCLATWSRLLRRLPTACRLADRKSAAPLGRKRPELYRGLAATAAIPKNASRF